MNAAGEWRTQALNDTSGPGQNNDNSTAVAGSCVLRVDGNSVSTPIKMGELSADGPTDARASWDLPRDVRADGPER